MAAQVHGPWRQERQEGRRGIASGVHPCAKHFVLVHYGQIPLQKQQKSRVSLVNTGKAGSIRTEVGRLIDDQVVLAGRPTDNDDDPIHCLSAVRLTIKNPFDGDDRLGRPF
jgi:hypothetical protein